MAFILLAVNGLQLSKLAVGPASGEMQHVDLQQAAKDFEDKNPPDPAQDLAATTPFADAPKPDKDAVITTNFGGNDKVGFYRLEQVPTTVLCDLIKEWNQLKRFAEWPESASQRPYDFSDFAYAARRKGKGNHSWFIKLNKMRGIWVSYGFSGTDTSVILSPAKDA
jgi:hypothetical protein